MRSQRDLIEATRAFVPESRLRSWWYVASTFAALALSVGAAARSGPWPFRLFASMVGGLVTVRLFILYHDYLHGALLRGSKLARVFLYPYGLLVMTPPRVWKETHNYHHSHTAKLVGSSIGSYATMSTRQWAAASPGERLRYKMVRHPLTVLFGYFTIFMLDMCLMSFLRSPRKRWDSALALALNWGLSALLITRFGFATFAFAYFLPLFIATGTGAYLFYAQHNFEDVRIQPREAWSYDRACLESSSYMETGPLLAWFTGNIGYHHVHHLNPTIPFYRLPEAMAAIPELQNPGKTKLTFPEIAACFRLKLWDPDQGKMVGYPG